MSKQITNSILMVRPAAFCYNAETASNNFFQNNIGLPQNELQQKVLQEFDSMVNVLRKHEIEVIVVNDTHEPIKPDAVFPNNWFNTTGKGVINVFPMYALSRRAEKRIDILHSLSEKYVVNNVCDWTEFEAKNMFLEGTGSLVIDHENSVLYACLSSRTNASVIEEFAKANSYKAIYFTAVDQQGKSIYHTNVMMCIGDEFAVICLDAIKNETEKIAVSQLLEMTGHE
ncbi:MAG: arginine deiminase-related protein [Chitinophagaceae bacterium]